MFRIDDKKRIYWLMDEFLSGTITGRKFSDEFYVSYDLEIDDSTLTDKEKDVFADLGNITSRFSEFKDDLVKFPKVYFSENQLRIAVGNAKEKLKKKTLPK